MQTFTSDLSNKKFPISERVSGKVVRDGVLTEIKKEHPDFNENCSIAVSELNQYRQLYIQRLLTNEAGVLNEMDKTVLDNINENRLMANEINETKVATTRGERWADRIAAFGGSWKFIGIFGFFLVAWMTINVVMLLNRGFDPYPFILLNLILSCLAAIQAPVIMMSQNRQEEKDRERARNDYMINLKSELEIRMLHEKIDHMIINQQENLLQIQQIQVDMMRELMDKLNGKSGKS